MQSSIVPRSKAASLVPNQSRGTILVIESSGELLKVLETLLSKHYEIVGSKNTISGLELIKKGVSPQVIIAETRTNPAICGGFLAETMQYLPDSVRVILTKDAKPETIVPLTNRAKAFMFIKKPISEIELTQAIRLCFARYETMQRMRLLHREIEAKNKELIDSINSAQATSFSSFLPQLNDSLSDFKSIYYVDFFKTCDIIISQIGSTTELDSTHFFALLLSIHTFIFAMNFMPDWFKLSDPENLTEDERNTYFIHWEHILLEIEKFGGLSLPVRFLEQVWENYDGSGYPKGLSGFDIMIESQILKFVFLYINSVFKIKKEQYDNRSKLPEYKQTVAETSKRHKAFIKILYDRVKWFYPKLADQYRMMLQDTQSETFYYERHDLIIENKDFEQPSVPKEMVSEDTSAKNTSDEDDANKDVIIDNSQATKRKQATRDTVTLSRQ